LTGAGHVVSKGATDDDDDDDRLFGNNGFGNDDDPQSRSLLSSVGRR